jgi:Protein of unknown function (DUF3606)
MDDDFKNISMKQEHEVRYWTERLGCSKDELAAAIAKVGNSVGAVRRELSRAWGYGRFRLGSDQDQRPHHRSHK